MPRKRTPTKPPADTESLATTPAATATLEPPTPANSEQAQVISEPQATDNSGQNQSFAERVGQKKPFTTTADPFGIASDNVAGVRLFESRQVRVMSIKFDEKPGPAILDKMKDAGYRWNPRDKIWVHPVRPDAARTTRIDAERLYQEVSGMLRQEKGIESSQEIPF